MLTTRARKKILDEILPSYIGIMISHYKDLYESISIMECHRGFGRCSNGDTFEEGMNEHIS